MVDFKKLVSVSDKNKKKIHPCEIYETLDRAVDKGPLRPVQSEILNLWYDNFNQQRDVILKLHTGQGKTLIGLLILQARLNQGKGPAVYLCPDKYLIEQTCQQAESFGISYTKFEGNGFEECLDGKKILITTVSKLFNGLSKFGLNQNSTHISTLLMDDSHACIDIIKNACKIVLPSDSSPYQELLTLFSDEIEKQGVGTFADIKNQQYDAFLPVPYWDWQDKETDVAKILSKYQDLEEIKFAWPLIKDSLKDCLCVISGNKLEIIPYIIPLDKFGSFFKADHRIFMSATLVDDSFFIKGLGLDPKTIKTPLVIKDEKWSGERMILIPSLIDESLDRETIVQKFGNLRPKNMGVVVLATSKKNCQDWQQYGCIISDKDNIVNEINKLKRKEFTAPLVIINRYDGIDLPDSTCRVLIFDSKPYAHSLVDRYHEKCRKNSNFINKKHGQTIEQGLGRAVRGEKDFCVVLVIAPDLVKFIKSKDSQKYFSYQTRTQISMGLEIAKVANQELESGETSYEVLRNTMNQLLNRDPDWKDYYINKMNSVEQETLVDNELEIFGLERAADVANLQQDYKKAIEFIQSIVDKYNPKQEEVGWYLQEMARIVYPHSKTESNRLQSIAHKKNRELLLPRGGVDIEQIPPIGLKRIGNIRKWINNFENYEELTLSVEKIISNLRFGVNYDDFEEAFNDLGCSLGFFCQRPDKEWKEGPDNLWNLKDGSYLLVECKNEVDLDRAEINKQETGQFNNSVGWFQKNYPNAVSKNILIIPTRKIGRAGALNFKTEIMKPGKIKKLTTNVKSFFKEFKSLDFKDIPDTKIQELLISHKLSVDDLLNEYSETTV